MNFHPIIKTCLDYAACGTVGASFVVSLPALVQIATLIWVAIRIYETRTVKRIIFGKE